MDVETATAIKELAETGRLSEESQFVVNDALGVATDEETEAHEAREKADAEARKNAPKSDEDDDKQPAKATAATKKASEDDDKQPAKATAATKKAS